jgi:hypothetical protein
MVMIVVVVVVVVVCMPMRNRLTIAAVADWQQRLAITMRGGNAIASQAVLALLKTGRAIPNRHSAVVTAVLLAAPRGTAYIYMKPEALISRSISCLSPVRGTNLRAPPLDGTSSHSVIWECCVCVSVCVCVCVRAFVCVLRYFFNFLLI